MKLDLLPVVLTSWAEWREQHPDTVVVDIETGYQRPYSQGAAYGDYFSSEETMFPVWQRSNLLETKAQIYALTIEGIPAAYPIDILASEQVVNDTVGETAVVLVSQRGVVDVAGESRRAGPVTYRAGSEVRAYARGQHTFIPGATTDTVIDDAGRIWRVTEEALLGPDGEEVPRINGHLAYWFGWFSFFPNTLLYEGQS